MDWNEFMTACIVDEWSKCLPDWSQSCAGWLCCNASWVWQSLFMRC